MKVKRIEQDGAKIVMTTVSFWFCENTWVCVGSPFDVRHTWFKYPNMDDLGLFTKIKLDKLLIGAHDNINTSHW